MTSRDRRNGRQPEIGEWTAGAWDTAPVLLDAIGADGTVVFCNATQAEALGFGKSDIVGQPAERFYLRESAKQLRAAAARCRPGTVDRHVRLQLRRRDGQPLSVTANLDVVDSGFGGRVLRIAKLSLDPALGAADRLTRENETLRGIVSTSKDALWCIEFTEPVDLTAPLSEAIRQFFENESYWRLCNMAMARLYKLPEELDFNEQHVRVAFPRNAENEEFVRVLIEHDFDIDGAPSLDHRYDGMDVYMENDVRGRIENGMLHRMWGAVRDLSGHKRKEFELANRLDATVEVLSAVPDPILVIGQDGVLEAANPAVEWRFGWQVDQVLGRPATDLVRFPDSFDPAADVVQPGVGNPAVDVTVRTASGGLCPCRAHLSALGGSARGRRTVLTLHPEALEGGATGRRRRRLAAAGPAD